MTYVNGKSVIAIGVILPVLGIASILSRFRARVARKAAVGLDDWLCLAALVLEIGCGITIIIGASGHAIGYHSNPQDVSNFYESHQRTQIFLEKCEFAFNILIIPALGLVKVSILLFYQRIFRGRTFKIISWTLIGIASTWAVAFLLVTIFDCRGNFEANWGSVRDLRAECIDTFEQLLALSISDVITDVCILTLPIPLVWRLQMPHHRKFAVLAIFMLGAFSVAAGITRMVIFISIFAPSQHNVKDPTVLGVPSTDDLGVVSIILFWAMIEIGVAVIAACLPTLRPLFQGFSPESIINSLRSAISLRSLRSDQSLPGPDVELGRSLSTTSDRPLKEFQNGCGLVIETKRNKYEV
ncbi:MAG: hypothetical protein LQ339_000711 [Xanthoria mediterranea]|nr:MAG: hypothetical protein LQ339_000711 [Xanthoria mediterranea]